MLDFKRAHEWFESFLALSGICKLKTILSGGASNNFEQTVEEIKLKVRNAKCARVNHTCMLYSIHKKTSLKVAAWFDHCQPYETAEWWWV